VTREREAGGWAYLSIVSAVPGVEFDVRVAIAVQFLAFEGTAIVLAATDDLWHALPFATVAIGVATAGSYLMVSLSDHLLATDPPERYRRLLFHSSIDVVMGVVAFVALVTYLLVSASAGAPSLLQRLVGTPLPAPAVFFGLLVAWDLCYRIGTGWWASVTGLWRTVAFERAPDADTRGAYARADLLTIAFAGVQILLVPFLRGDSLLLVTVVGHVGAVVLVSGLSYLLVRRS
jgi:hypothetical protein